MKIGIVVQGSYIKGYTCKTLKLYKENKNIYKICLSTWVGEVSSEDKSIIKELGIEILENVKPQLPGIQNINFQILSTINGINLLELFGCDVIIKTRTDHKINLLDKLIKFYDSEKIVAFEMSNIMNKLYLVNDFLFFGSINKLKELFSLPLNQSTFTRVLKDQEQRKLNLQTSFFAIETNCNNNILEAERYLITEYMKSKGYILTTNNFFELFNFLNFMFENFILIDHRLLNYETTKVYHAMNYTDFKFKKYQNIFYVYKISFFILLIKHFVQKKINCFQLSVKMYFKIFKDFRY